MKKIINVVLKNAFEICKYRKVQYSDIRLLLESVIQVKNGYTIAYPEREITLEEDSNFQKMIKRLLNYESVGRILGHVDFWKNTFEVTPDTLEPRSDTEVVVKVAIQSLQEKKRAYLAEFGTGTGCILLSILQDCQQAKGIGTDLDNKILECAYRNALKMNLLERSAFLLDDWNDPNSSIKKYTEFFDLIVSNPPYISFEEIKNISPTVYKYDPMHALTDGKDGLNSYKKISCISQKLLKKNGFLIFEIGYKKEQYVENILLKYSFYNIRRYKDMSGKVRCISAQKS